MSSQGAPPPPLPGAAAAPSGASGPLSRRGPSQASHRPLPPRATLLQTARMSQGSHFGSKLLRFW
ncbi:hypothetical protein U9M48_018784 [Paspalum notatum var. saurae]|uniref:Uncharacterized protein n=1 Tax=Paspalum notatum var. saurae TaxID=547442 RepID=A0AAQ3TDL6_PASNO